MKRLLTARKCSDTIRETRSSSHKRKSSLIRGKAVTTIDAVKKAMSEIAHVSSRADKSDKSSDESGRDGRAMMSPPQHVDIILKIIDLYVDPSVRARIIKAQLPGKAERISDEATAEMVVHCLMERTDICKLRKALEDTELLNALIMSEHVEATKETSVLLAKACGADKVPHLTIYVGLSAVAAQHIRGQDGAGHVELYNREGTHFKPLNRTAKSQCLDGSGIRKEDEEKFHLFESNAGSAHGNGSSHENGEGAEQSGEVMGTMNEEPPSAGKTVISESLRDRIQANRLAALDRRYPVPNPEYDVRRVSAASTSDKEACGACCASEQPSSRVRRRLRSKGGCKLSPCKESPQRETSRTPPGLVERTVDHHAEGNDSLCFRASALSSRGWFRFGYQ